LSHCAADTIKDRIIPKLASLSSVQINNILHSLKFFKYRELIYEKYIEFFDKLEHNTKQEFLFDSVLIYRTNLSKNIHYEEYRKYDSNKDNKEKDYLTACLFGCFTFCNKIEIEQIINEILIENDKTKIDILHNAFCMISKNQIFEVDDLDVTCFQNDELLKLLFDLKIKSKKDVSQSYNVSED